MSSPERRALMERNISRLALLIQQLGEEELANSQRRARWEQWMQENDQRLRERDQRVPDGEIRLNEQDAARAERIRALIKAAVEIQTDVARIDAAS